MTVGRDGTYTPVADAEAMRAAIPGSTPAVVESAAQLPNPEEPDAFNAAPHDFLAALY